MDFEVTEYLEAVDDYKEAKERYDNDPYPEYGIGSWGAMDLARSDMNVAFRNANKAALCE